MTETLQVSPDSARSSKKRTEGSLLTVLIFFAVILGIGRLYSVSPHLFLRTCSTEWLHNRISVAVTAVSKKGERRLGFLCPGEAPNRQRSQPDDSQAIGYRLKEGQFVLGDPGEWSATLTVQNLSDDSQLVRVFEVGDTPQTSLPEYRIVDNKVLPSRYAHSDPAILIGLLFSPIIASCLSRLLRRTARRLLAPFHFT